MKVIISGKSTLVDLVEAMRTLKQVYGINRLLCEGGPTLYGYMSRAGLMDEKFLTISQGMACQGRLAKPPSSRSIAGDWRGLFHSCLTLANPLTPEQDNQDPVHLQR
jgi:riboflavin biosynthesis pyrimidine reductase